jgi:predicted DNA binding CopG/RHH family protein
MAHKVRYKDRVLTVRVSASLARSIEQSANRCGVPVSVWVRSIIAQASSRDWNGSKYIRIREPNGATI